MLQQLDQNLLNQVADLHQIPTGAYNIRKNGKSIMRNTTANIDITNNNTGDGIIINIKPNTKNQSVHIPVILSESGLSEAVKNDFIIGDNSEVTIIAGCGIHNSGTKSAEHSGIHSFTIGKNCKVIYIEKHYGEGTNPNRVMNPITQINIADNSYFKMETAQISGITLATRTTTANIGNGAVVEITEKLMTEDNQQVTTNFIANLNGVDSKCHIISRAVAKGSSHQYFNSTLNGSNKSFGHSECDAIVMDNAKVFASPVVNALSTDASLVHEAAIGKIAGEQITKLLTLGFTEEEAQNLIINGFLK